MALLFHPNPGTILVCDFRGYVAPEMVKARPVIVISPRLRNRDGLCTVVPLSTTPPHPVELYHCEIEFDRPLPGWSAQKCWVKGDMIATVSFERLSLFRVGKDHAGKRKYLKISIKPVELQIVKTCVLHGLGLHGFLTK